MRIASFNINGIRARLPRVTEWLVEESIDIALLQEIKATDDAFPRAPFEELGYNVATHGQKGFNGVAILSKLPLEDVTCGLPGDPDDAQARWIEATVVGARALRLCNLYLPNGNPAPGPKYDYKLAWMARLETRARALMDAEEPALIGGDWNVIPQPEDAHDPGKWRDDALFLPETRRAFRRILHLGFTDALRAVDASPMLYTFWDFQKGAWNRNDGIRIDHMLLTPQAADLLQDAHVDRHMRGRERPSDHAPVRIELDV